MLRGLGPRPPRDQIATARLGKSMSVEWKVRAYVIDGYRQEYCRIYRAGHMIEDWACECAEFARRFECVHAQQATAIRALERQVEDTGFSSTTRQ
jgi:hypothetical protein